MCVGGGVFGGSFGLTHIIIGTFTQVLVGVLIAEYGLWRRWNDLWCDFGFFVVFLQICF